MWGWGLLALVLLAGASSSSAPRRALPTVAELRERLRRFRESGATDAASWQAFAIEGISLTSVDPYAPAADGGPRGWGRDVVLAIEELKREAPPAAPAMGASPFGLYVPDWPKKPTPKPRTNAVLRRGRPVCYRTKADALNVFKEYNQHVLQHRGGGLYERDSSGQSFDPINHKYGLEGRHKVTTMREALWVAMPPGAPYCLARIDLETLNELLPAKEAGGFRLPDHVYEEAAAGGQAEYYRQRGEGAPF